MSETFEHRDLTGATFRSVDLDGASFEHVSLARARFRDVDLTGLRIADAQLQDVEIGGEVQGLRINGVDVGPLIEAELERQHPERAHLRPTDADGFRRAWTIIEDLWAGTVERARALEPALLDERVDGEFSFIQTLRHLLFATDSWVVRGILGEPAPWHPLGLPWDGAPEWPEVRIDREARPPLDEVLALRADRMATVRRVVDDLTDEQLAGTTEPVDGPGWPPPKAFPVQQVLSTILDEEWWHRRYAERDLDALLAREA